MLKLPTQRTEDRNTSVQVWRWLTGKIVFAWLLTSVLLPSIGLAQHPWANSAKRGVGMSLAQPDQAANLVKLDDLDVPWFYSWGAEPLPNFAALPDGNMFVPMSWGQSAPQNYQAIWTANGQVGLYDTLLGFNEPDLASQANMTVNEALNLWPQLEATGLRLGSPAAANFFNGWMLDFMDGVQSQGLRVDFLAVHRYSGADGQAFLSNIDIIHSQYNMPIWITEFAVRDGSAATPADNKWTDQQVYNFMSDVLPGLESRSFVERYAWFPGSRDNPFLTSSALFENDGKLTKLGRLYVGHEEVVPDGGMLLNSGFDATALVPPVYSVNGADDWTTINDADTSAYYAHTGRQSLSLAPGLPNGQSRPGIARQEFSIGVDVAINETYSLGAWVFHPSNNRLTGTREGTLRIQWFDAGGSLLGDERVVAIDASSPTDEWFFVSLEDVLIPNNPNIQEVRATLWVNNIGPTSVNSGVAYFDDVYFKPGSMSALSNPGFEGPQIPAGQTQLPGADDWTTINTAGVRSTVQHSGDQSMRLAPGGPSGTTAPGICRQEFEVGPDIFTNLPYSMGAWVYNHSEDPITGDRKGQLRIQWFNASNQLLNQAVADVADASTPTDQWIFVRLENVLIPDNSNIAEVHASLFVVNGAGTNGGPVFFDDVTFIQGETAVASGVVPGDANGDGVLDNLDITAFGQALFMPATYAAAYPGVDTDVVLDMNNDGVFNNLDIADFAAALGF